MSHVIPNLTVLTQNQIEDLHNIALTILEKTGVRIDNQKARALVEQKIGQKSVNNRVYLPRELVQWAIDAAPGKVEVKQSGSFSWLHYRWKRAVQQHFRNRRDQFALSGSSDRQGLAILQGAYGHGHAPGRGFT